MFLRRRFVITVTHGGVLARNSQVHGTFSNFLACELRVGGDICKCSLTIENPEVLDGRSTGSDAERRDLSPSCRTRSLRSAVGRIASKALSQRRRTARRSSSALR